jgi:hypothetical protein
VNPVGSADTVNELFSENEDTVLNEYVAVDDSETSALLEEAAD